MQNQDISLYSITIQKHNKLRGTKIKLSFFEVAFKNIIV